VVPVDLATLMPWKGRRQTADVGVEAIPELARLKPVLKYATLVARERARTVRLAVSIERFRLMRRKGRFEAAFWLKDLFAALIGQSRNSNIE
jgi:hypothetical protein